MYLALLAKIATRTMFVMFASILLYSSAACSSNPYSGIACPESNASNPETGRIIDSEGYVSIFDGETLDNWEGDPVYWSVRDSSIVGTITPETRVQRNTFIIWRGGIVSNFELKLEYRITPGGNSGINYRSEEVQGIPFALRGYQADIKNGPRYTGQNYEERGREFLARRGESTILEPGQPPRLVEQIGDHNALNEHINHDGWNEYHLVVRGNRMIHYVNGVQMSEVLDNDPEHRRLEGLLGMQVHVGPPMTIEYRRIRLKPIQE